MKDQDSATTFQSLVNSLFHERIATYQELLYGFRKACVLFENDDLSLYMIAIQILQKENATRIRAVQGDKAFYELSAMLISDKSIDALISTMALVMLIHEFGVDLLHIDDRFPNALLQKKEAGKDRQCMVEALCEIASADQEKGAGFFNILVHIVPTLDNSRAYSQKGAIKNARG